MRAKVKIVEVGPRDGLQNESKKVSIDNKVELIKKLSASGLKQIEVGAFVSPKWIPQMKGSVQVVEKVHKLKNTKKIEYSALVPNKRGLEDALKTPIKSIAVFGATSETFSQKNINCSVKESLKRFSEVIKQAKLNKVKVRGYLSTSFGCPYEGRVSPSKVVKLTQAYLNLGVYEVAISDTIGVATPKDIEKVVLSLKKAKIDFSRIAFHLHNTRGTALANVLRSYQLGIRTFDTSIGGLGGCPYAKGASGNLATEQLVYMLEGMGIKTGVDLEKLVKIRHWLKDTVKLKPRVS